MPRIIILEGTRGTGKSTLARELRQKLPETTLINFTGFHKDGEEGLSKVEDYYSAWIGAFFKLLKHDSTYVFDRCFFSEKVYSKLYKDYNFTGSYDVLCDKLTDLADMGVKIDIIYLTVESKFDLKERLNRDKVPFASVKESVEESLKQQEEYNKVIDSFYYNYASYTENIKIHKVDTTGKWAEHVEEEVINIIKTAQ
ncbi:thymidylate kinase [Bacillus phage vB_BanS_Chewbecca]|uniref:Adenylate kinase 5 n=2 Tax=Tsamsavirus TaxID=3044849 RepID=A0AAE8YVA0_9CAUD|nr:thymidylate kinase [Bacillus phage vB_BanS_Skywalker]YP_010681208.1 thymidylate kinase [Bacillus phage vB_BanS_Chewbecca]UGO46148.1 hypothetical protein CHEWBECCA_65 [Bacillus phage vB_BanS_Chewbecca]UGO51353.1 adenylate kinase 5 [Bacillus phage vB_BanS_Skywalker]